MDIFTALIGNNLNEIKKAQNFSSKEEAENFLESKKNGDKAGIINGEVETNTTDSDKEDSINKKSGESWSVVDNKRIDGVLCKNKNNEDLWLIIKINGREIKTNFINTNNKECSKCEEKLTPYTEQILKCKKCNSLFKDGEIIKKEDFNEILNAARSINIQSNSEENDVEKSKIEFNNKEKLPGMLEDSDFS